MARIVKILGADNRGKYAIVYVLLNNGEEAEVYVGGMVEAYYDDEHDKVKAFVKKA